MKRTELPRRLQKIVDYIPYVAIATTCPDGSPWNTPVAGFHFDNEFTIYWASWSDNQHSQNIRQNGKAFIVIFDSAPANGKPSQGIYMQCDASVLTDRSDVMKAAKVFGDDVYNPSDGNEYLGDKPRRIYRALPVKIWVNNDDKIDGNFVDVRNLVFEKA